MLCPHCGFSMNGFAKDCPKCARKIPKSNRDIVQENNNAHKTNVSHATIVQNANTLMVCPQCGLTMTGVSRCPRCLAAMQPGNNTQTSGGKSSHIKIKPVLWDNDLTTTQNILREAEVIHEAFEDIAQRNKKIEADFLLMQNEYKTKYTDKLSQLEQERNLEKSAAATRNNDSTRDLNDTMTKLTQFEKAIPYNLKNGYQKKGYYPSIAPDFFSLSSLLTETQKPDSMGSKTFFFFLIIGGIIGLFSGGLTGGLIGGGLGIVSALLINIIGINNKANNGNMLMDNIESGKVYINSCLSGYQDEFSRAINNADIKYEAAKADADAKLSGYLSKVEQERNANITKLDTEEKSLRNDPKLADLKSRIIPIMEKLGATENTWNSDFGAVSDYPSEILLGTIQYTVTMPNPIKLLIPFTKPMNRPVQLIIDYDNSGKAKVMSGIQSFLMKLLKFMPLFSFKITYIDPNDRGSNLGPLQKLSAITCFDVCKVYASREDIQKRLKELEKFVDKTSAALVGTDSVYSYNVQGNNPLEYHFVIINDYPKNFERYSVESLEVLINNSRKCGISLLFTTSSGTSDLPPEVVNKYNTIKVHKNEISVDFKGVPYPFFFDNLTNNCEDFLEKFKNVCNEGIRIDNDFASYFPVSKSRAPQFEDATNKMLIPFAVDSRKNLMELELGSPLTAHALLSGTTGSGKSTTLHMLIMSIIMKYHPDDVQLWLVDYKRVEFAEYIEKTPPHVKLIGLERSKEFTFSLLDWIDKEFQSRAELFKRSGVNNISEYRKIGGKIPRIILIIDEFHQMTQTIQNELRYSQILENILSEYRAFGLSCVFSDQAISSGLRGLSEKGRMQIRARIAMHNEFQEMRETLALDSGFYDDELKNKMRGMGVGDVIFSCTIEDEAGETRPVVDKYKTVNIQKQERVSVIDWVIKSTGVPEKKPLIIDGLNRISFNKNVIEVFEQENTTSTDKLIPLYVGTPASLDPCFCFYLREKIGSNLLVIGAEDDLRAAVIYWAIYSFKRQKEYKVYIFADKNDELFTQYRKSFLSLKSKNIVVTTDLGEICGVINDLHGSLKPGNQRTLVVWLGLENIAEELLFLPVKEKTSTEESKTAPIAVERSPFRSGSAMAALESMDADLDAKANELFGKSISELLQDDSVKQPEGAEVSGLNGLEDQHNSDQKNNKYNAAGDIREIIDKGSRYGIFTLASFTSYRSLKDTKFITADNFEHKIAFNMSMDESSNYLGRSSYASGLDSITAVYYDGTSVKAFRPYLL